MHKIIWVAFLLLVMASISGCVTFGDNFVRPESDKLVLGHTSYTQVIQLMGTTKYKNTELWMNDKLIKSLQYSYFSSNINLTRYSRRELNLSFYNDVLVGQRFSSSFESDNTIFDDSKIDQIIKGKSSLNEVIQLLGNPTIFNIPPMLMDNNINTVKEVGYHYFKEIEVHYRKHKRSDYFLTISLDNKNIVTKVDFNIEEKSF